MIQVLPEEMTIPVLPDHFSFQNLFSQVSNRLTPFHHCIVKIVLTCHHISLCPHRIECHIIHGSHPLLSGLKFLLPAGCNRRHIEKHSRQQTIYRPNRLVFPSPYSQKKNQNHKEKASSLAHLSYVLTSCSHSSFSGNQNGPTSYSCCRELELINVYTSCAFEPSRSMDSPRIPWANRLKGPKHPSLPASSSSLSTLSNQQLLRQAARILCATLSRPGLKPEAHIPPGLLESEAHVLPA